MHALQFGRREHRRLVPLIALDLVGKAEFLEHPKDTLRARIFEMMDDQGHGRAPRACCVDPGCGIEHHLPVVKMCLHEIFEPVDHCRPIVFDGAGDRSRDRSDAREERRGIFDRIVTRSSDIGEIDRIGPHVNPARSGEQIRDELLIGEPETVPADNPALSRASSPPTGRRAWSSC